MVKKGTVCAEKINELFDAGTFVEIGSYVRRNGKPQEYEGVVCGYGAIGGKLAFAFSQDSERMKGCFDEIHARKIEKLYEMAVKNGAPVVAVFDSAGASVYEGSAVLSGYGRVMKCVSDASGIIPQLAIVGGICAGMSAVTAAMFDVVVTVKDKSKLYVNPPFVIGNEFGTSEYSAANGVSAVSAEDDAAAIAKIRKLVEILPSNNAEGAVLEVNEDDLNRTVSIDGLSAIDVVKTVADCGEFEELYANYAPEMIVGFASFGGIGAGVVYANGKLTVKGAKKAAKLVSMCDSFDIPVLTFVDSDGIDSDKADEAIFASELAKLASAYTVSKNAKVTVVLGKAYGASYTIMGSKSVGADIAFALEKACISVLPPEASVAFVWNDKITAEKSREALEAEWKEKCASPFNAAEHGDIDDVIDEAELRQRICAALGMLYSKADIAPSRRHPNMPL